MQLTEVQCLDANYTQSDVNEMVTVMHSTVLSAPSSILRWSNVAPSEAYQWLLKMVTASVATEFERGRITEMIEEGDLPSTPRADHLVVRDLDLEHLEGSEHTPSTPGRIVAHADYRYAFIFGRAAKQHAGEGSAHSPMVYPDGFGRQLHDTINKMVESTLQSLFGGLPCFELYGISTLTPSHLRKGIAKRLTEWIFPYADHFSLPVILCASPAGLPLYRKCGFEEYRDHDVRIELEKFGGEGLHFHVPMVRWPANPEKLPDAWKQWRKEHRAGPPASE